MYRTFTMYHKMCYTLFLGRHYIIIMLPISWVHNILGKLRQSEVEWLPEVTNWEVLEEVAIQMAWCQSLPESPQYPAPSLKGTSWNQRRTPSTWPPLCVLSKCSFAALSWREVYTLMALSNKTEHGRVVWFRKRVDPHTWLCVVSSAFRRGWDWDSFHQIRFLR